MTEIESNLATILSVPDKLKGFDSSIGFTPEPAVLLQDRTKNVFLNGGAEERFSDKYLTIHPNTTTAHDDVVPIDLLLGNYDPASRKITIHVEMIKKIAERFRWDFQDLLFLVRLHEYSHALVHLGVWQAEVDRVLSLLDESGYTDWDDFLARRDSAFAQLSEEEHEFMAQGISFTALNAIQGEKGRRLRDLFGKLESKQPAQYQISADVKEDIKNVDWSLALRFAQKERSVPEMLIEGRSSFELLVAISRSSSSVDMEVGQREWTVSLDDGAAIANLDSEMSALDMGHGGPSREEAEFLVERFKDLRIEIFSREHSPPHFRVKRGNESANFAIEDGRKINGRLNGYTRVIQEWHRKHKELLIEAWNARRPSDCPVGEYRE